MHLCHDADLMLLGRAILDTGIAIVCLRRLSFGLCFTYRLYIVLTEKWHLQSPKNFMMYTAMVAPLIA